VFFIASGPFTSNVNFGLLLDFVDVHGAWRRFRSFKLSSSSSSSESEMIPAGIAIVTLDVASIPASWQTTANCLNPGAMGKVATSLFPNLICFVNPFPQYSLHPFPSVCSPQVSRFFLFDVCDRAQCCGLSNLTLPSGT
jgi:hypothetical protein